MSAIAQPILGPLPLPVQYAPPETLSYEESLDDFALLEDIASTSSEEDAWSDERNLHLLTGHRVCHRCKSRIEIGPTTTRVDLISLVHTICPNCSAAQCRGCSSPKPLCGPRCKDGTCPQTTSPDGNNATTYCPGSRAIAIFESLSEFDKELSSLAAHLSQTGVWPVPRTERSTFLVRVAARTDARLSNRFNKLLCSTLTAITTCLGGGGGGQPSSTETVPPTTPTTAIDPVIRPLLTTSFLFEAIHAYLRHDRYVNWAINARDAYIPILSLLHTLGNRRSLADLVRAPLPAISRSSGVQVVVWYNDPAEVDGQHAEPLLAAVFSGDAQKGVEDLEKVLEKHGSAAGRPISNLRMAFYRLLLLDLMGPTLP